MTINGKGISSKATFPVINPANEEAFAHAPDCSEEELNEAVAAAQKAFPKWAATDIKERRALIIAVANAIEANVEGLAKLLTTEQGKPFMASEMELRGAADWMRKTAQLEIPEISHEIDGSRFLTRHLPLGVVAAIPAWNYPVNLSALKIAPALLAGNTLILKPSPFTPLSMLKIAELAREILPPGVFSVVSGNDKLGPMMTSHPGFSKIGFTGSTATGRKIMESAAPTLKRLTLELGGNDPAIVMSDVDVKAVAQTLFWCSFTNSGQICMAAKRIYVHADIYNVFVKTIVEMAQTVKVGDGMNKDVQLGPISNRPQFERLVSLIQDSLDHHYEILVGGLPKKQLGYFVPVTVIGNPPESARIVQEEQFGPVLPIMKFTDVEDAISRANATEVGLGATVWCKDSELALSIAKRIESGTVWVNEAMHLSTEVPFGGLKQSGIGAEGGIKGLLEYTVPQTIWSKKEKS